MLKPSKRVIFIAMLVAVSATKALAAAPITPSASTPRSLTPDQIFKRYKDAVVRIEVSLRGASLGVGSGFFISSNGEIATSLHVIRPFMVHPETELKVKLASGRVFTTATVGRCSDERGVDLCLLKVNTKPISFLPVNFSKMPVDVTPGESIVAIGHPRDLDFSISTGIVSALRQNPAGWREIQIDAAISPGNSGGPVINRLGQAIGVVYQFERDGQNLNFAIRTSEVENLLRHGEPYLTPSGARQSFSARSKKIALEARDHSIIPAVQTFSAQRLKSVKKMNPTGFKWMRAQLAGTAFSMLLPSTFSSCEKTETETPENASTSCSSSSGDVVVTIQKRPRNLSNSLESYRGRRLVESRPLTIVERLEAEGQWDDARSQNDSFMSRPSTSRCSAINATKRFFSSSDTLSKVSLSPGGFFETATSICRFETENDSEPGAISTSQWIEMGGEFYGINVWASDPGRLTALQGLSDLILVSAGRSGGTAVRPNQRVNSSF